MPCLHLRVQFILHHLLSYTHHPTKPFQQTTSNNAEHHSPCSRGPKWDQIGSWRLPGKFNANLNWKHISSAASAPSFDLGKPSAGHQSDQSPIPSMSLGDPNNSDQNLLLWSRPSTLWFLEVLHLVMDLAGDEKILCDFASRQSPKFFYVCVYYTPEN